MDQNEVQGRNKFRLHRPLATNRKLHFKKVTNKLVG